MEKTIKSFTQGSTSAHVGKSRINPFYSVDLLTVLSMMQVLQRIQDCGFDVGDPDSEASFSKTHADDVSKMLKRCGYHDDAGHSKKRKHHLSQSKQSNKEIRKAGKYFFFALIVVELYCILTPI